MKIDQNGILYYEVGDIVTVLPTPQHKVHGVSWVSEMDVFCGSRLTIVKARYFRGNYMYSVKENGWTWVNEFFEPPVFISEGADDDFDNYSEVFASFIAEFSVSK